MAEGAPSSPSPDKLSPPLIHLPNGTLAPLPSATSTTADVVPSPHPYSRTLVLCFDGTGDQFSLDNSNIIQFFSLLSKDDPDHQLAYYQAGIGTYTIPQIATPFMANISKTIDMMIGNHLDAHVMGGYEFLMQNYKAGDKICLFGFSRGAYTARALAGMIYKVGLLPRCNHQQVPFAYKMYSKDDEVGRAQSRAFKKAFSIDVNIEFVGVWDTVNSVGLIPHRLPFTRANNAIRYFRHALSLDERRVRFKANHYNWDTEDDPKPGVTHDAAQQNSRTINETDVEEVWFAGVHADVGGGSVRNNTRNSLARISLRWMIRQCFLTKTGILFHRSMFEQIGMDWKNLCPTVAQRLPVIYQTPRNDVTIVNNDAMASFHSEEDEDLADALCPIYDQLQISPWWWILEVTPQPWHRQNDDNSWDDSLRINLGAGRQIPRQHNEGVRIKFHRTVDIRMKAQGLSRGEYLPKAKLDAGVEPEWVD